MDDDGSGKLIPTYRIGKRDFRTTQLFVSDLASRLSHRAQISADALVLYVDAIDNAFAANVDFGQIVKFYEATPVGAGRYSPPHVAGTEKRAVHGQPDPAHISTSGVERSNLTVRLGLRRFTRLTNGFSKKPENLRAAVAMFFGYYNFVRRHRTTQVTPAMAAGVTSTLWKLEELIERACEVV